MKQISRRDALWSIAGFASVGLVTACQSPSPAAKTEPNPAATAQPTAAPAAAPTQAPAAVAKTGSTVKIVYWGSFSGTNGKAEEEVVTSFNAAQKDVEVEYQFQGSYEDTAQKLTAALQARTAPDVSLLSDVWWFKFYLNKAIVPLDDLMKAENVDRSDYVDVLLNEGVRKGQTFWVPFARSTPIFYYNRDAWAKAGLPDRGPRTWDELVKEWVPSLKGLAENVFAHPGAASYIAWLFQGVIWQWGGEFSDPEFKIKIQEPQGVAAGEFYRSSIVDGWAAAVKDVDADFRSGTALSTLGSTAGLAGHQAAAKFQVGTAFLPEGPSGFGCCTGGSGMSIINGTPPEKQQAAMKFINYATGQATTKWSQSTGYMPVRKSSINSPAMADWYKQQPNFKTVVDQLPKTRPQDAARVFIPNGDQIIGKGLERITITQESAEPVWKEVAATLEREAQPVLRAIQALGA